MGLRRRAKRGKKSESGKSQTVCFRFIIQTSRLHGERRGEV